jgi:hypothetical protein
MPRGGLCSRLLCTLFTCVVLSFSVAPTQALTRRAPIEARAVEAEPTEASAPGPAATSPQVVGRVELVLGAASFAPQKQSRSAPPRLATDHLVRVPALYLQHCALLC